MMPYGYCVATRDLKRELDRLDREEELDRWRDAGSPECPWEGDDQAMRDHCPRCTLKACELSRIEARKKERADQLRDFLWDLGKKSMQRMEK